MEKHTSSSYSIYTSRNCARTMRFAPHIHVLSHPLPALHATQYHPSSAEPAQASSTTFRMPYIRNVLMHASAPAVWVDGRTLDGRSGIGMPVVRARLRRIFGERAHSSGMTIQNVCEGLRKVWKCVSASIHQGRSC